MPGILVLYEIINIKKSWYCEGGKDYENDWRDIKKDEREQKKPRLRTIEIRKIMLP